MEYTYKKMKNLFLRQSYLDSWEDYERSLNKTSFIKWDYIILTASNEEQAATYREQIDYRLINGRLPAAVHYAVLPDPEGKRVGSGGATLAVLRYIAEQEAGKPDFFAGRRILVIHSGGDSKRVPQYSATGKLFSSVPRELPDGNGSTLFDEFIIGMSGVPSRIREGMLVLSGDVLLLFNPLQIDAAFHGAAAISIKEHVSTGKDHGVFLGDGEDNVKQFLHKQTEEHLREVGAVNEHDFVDLDTGAVLFDSELLNALYGLISTDGKIDDGKFQEFVNDRARISFYGDFLYPLASESTLAQYYEEAAEGTKNQELMSCRKKIWDALHHFSMKLICLSPAEFIHFGTTKELLALVTKEVEDYEFLDWKKKVKSAAGQGDFAAHNAYIGHAASIGTGAYIENSYVLGASLVEEGAVVSGLHLRDACVPAHTVWHGITLKDGKKVIRVYAVKDNPKGSFQEQAGFLDTTLPQFMEKNGLVCEDLWDGEEKDLWRAKLYPVCDREEDALRAAELLGKMAKGNASPQEIRAWKDAERMSLYSSFNQADVLAGSLFERELESRILASQFISLLKDGVYYQDALKIFGRRGITEEIYQNLMADANEADEFVKMRIYYAVSRFMKAEHRMLEGKNYDYVEGKCFLGISNMIYEDARRHLPDNRCLKISEEKVEVALPVRVNWGGGWTDTPPHCNERGGVVLNAAIRLNKILPVQVCVRRLDNLWVEFASQDIGVYGTAHTADEIRDCHNPYDSFALHKAALIACGLIPLEDTSETLEEILERLGGGIYISTQVLGVPKGSGLGTSSILSAACVKAIFRFLGREMSNEEIYDIVLCMEQIMSTGGGWQDQVGGLTEGIKFIRSEPGIHQHLKVETVHIPEKAQQELQERFALIYTGQRRLARNLLRDVVGNYIGGRPQSVQALEEMAQVSALMRFELERGNVDGFARLLNRHWELSKQLDEGSTNTCIEQMFMVCDDLISGRFISGAGGGGFLQVILKKGVSRETLRKRLKEIFQDSGVDVWDCDILF